MADFDVLIIGTGSGNSIVNHRFDGLRVAIAEEWHFGGTCLNVGCIPTKMFVRAADVAEDAKTAQAVDVEARYEGVEWDRLRERIFGRIDAIEADGRDYRTHRQDNVTVFAEHVAFTGPGSFATASGERFTAERVVIAAGSTPRDPQIAGIDGARIDSDGYPVHTSDSIMRLPSPPRSLIILGSGYIAMEFAHIFAGLGTEVTVVVRGPRLLGDLDEDVSAAFTKIFADSHSVRFGLEAERVEVGGPGGVSVALSPTGRVADATAQSLQADALLIATGRVPNTAALDAQAAGIDVREDGRIAVDAYQRVLAGGEPLPGAFALGDVSSPFQLKHVANHEARVVKHNLLADIAAGAPGSAPVGDLEEVNHHAVPAAVFTRPQVASVGETEAALRERGARCVAHTQPYSSTAYGWALNDETSFVKVLADPATRLILGAQIVGPEASIIIQPLIQAMAFGQRADDVAQHQYWIHPALTEVIENALLGLDFDAD
ncbi:mycothione reductase [Brevibacterium sp. 5221]|uniref:Mycothione reductase n=1 Tax=Brevibacterium rongguiense TaxID=2695267 RepID=A0A6N9H5B7_9MICO|nr:mycothione reductase [Brevibacterium rongguiense]MYM18986.1 mycothione reductase [Brevibacterium rongguiense]